MTGTGIRLIVGLANPGKEYQATRHNAGAWFIEHLTNKYQATLSSNKKLFGLSGQITVDNQDCFLLIPTTYMNNSGQAVSAAAKYYKLSNAEILVAHDELDLKPGDIRLKFEGGHGGHNGLRDIFKPMGKDFYRLRIGIGKPPQQGIEHVLGVPSKNEQELINQSIEHALLTIPDLLQGNIDKATKEINTRG